MEHTYRIISAGKWVELEIILSNNRHKRTNTTYFNFCMCKCAWVGMGVDSRPRKAIVGVGKGS